MMTKIPSLSVDLTVPSFLPVPGLVSSELAQYFLLHCTLQTSRTAALVPAEAKRGSAVMQRNADAAMFGLLNLSGTL